MKLSHYYRRPALSPAGKNGLLSAVRQTVLPGIKDIETEYCFNVGTTDALSNEEQKVLQWLLAETFEPEHFSEHSFLTHPPSPILHPSIIEVGPRMNFTTAWSTNAVSVCHACGLTKITRIERSRRYKVVFEPSASQPLEPLNPGILAPFLNLIHDRMTECLYPQQLATFETGITPEPFSIVPLKEKGKEALRTINAEMGLGLDDWDIDYYYHLFVHEIGRNPTTVECFDLGQSNSEHSRHWFFRGRLIIDGQEMPHTLMEVIRHPLEMKRGNSVIAFKDNSSAIRGYAISSIVPENALTPSRFRDEKLTYHIIFTAETHNFPTGVAPFPGAETGTGGRIRDVHATGKGSLVVAGTAAYCVGNLQIPGYLLPWEDPSFAYPPNLASPLQIEIRREQRRFRLRKQIRRTAHTGFYTVIRFTPS